jgi:hypothetical protein
MRIEQKWSLGCACAVLAQVLVLASLPYELREPVRSVWHFLAGCAIALLLWVAFDGNRLVLSLKEILCAASSQRSRRATSSRS